MAGTAALVLAVFLTGIVTAVITLVSLAVRREDRFYRLEDLPGSAREVPSVAVRRLAGIGRPDFPPPGRRTLGSRTD